MRILYLPIYEPGSYNERAKANKHGLRTALAKWGEVREFDYIAPELGQIRSMLMQLIAEFAPDILFTQLQGVDRITVDILRTVRQFDPSVKIVNWNGDYWPSHLVSADMLILLKDVDLQLVVNASVLETYKDHGINAAFWPHAFETPVRELPDVPAYDVVYLANAYSEKRKAIEPLLRSLPCSVGIYGSGWQSAQGECTYDFTYGEALYRRAKLTISDNEYTDALGYLSNRPFQAMAAGCLVLQQHVQELNKWTKLIAGTHYIHFDNLDELPALVNYCLRPENEADRLRIAKAGQRFVHTYHSFDARVGELLTTPLGKVQRV